MILCEQSKRESYSSFCLEEKLGSRVAWDSCGEGVSSVLRIDRLDGLLGVAKGKQCSFIYGTTHAINMRRTVNTIC